MSPERRRRNGNSVDRPLQYVQLRVDYSLAVAADRSPEALADTLALLTSVGLHGLVVTCDRVELNGQRFADSETLQGTPSDVDRLRPSPDQRILAAVPQLLDAVRLICAGTGLKLPDLLAGLQSAESVDELGGAV